MSDKYFYIPDTIAAQATPSGKGGVGVIRISGPAVRQLCQTLLKKELTPRLATFLPFFNQANEILDQGIALYFPKPHSFTGEDVLELQGHGGPIVMDHLLKAIYAQGVRAANPGEFSLRAFLNNKIDLTQAEAIADLIDAQSEQAAKSALRSLQGEFSKRIQALVEQLITLRMMVEAAIDFSEEEIDFLKESTIEKDLQKLLTNIQSIFQEANQGILLREGITVVIVGKPNAGKSSLLNCLSGRDSAIVTDVPGTTRDVLREYIHIDGMPLHVVDTAGLRESDDVIEKEGMRRALAEIKKADLILLVQACDDNETESYKIPTLLEPHVNTIPWVIIRNKIDLQNETPRIEEHVNSVCIHLSAKHHQGIDLLKDYFKSFMGYHQTSEGQFIARRRHLNAIEKASSAIQNGLQQWRTQSAGELLAEDLRQAQYVLGEITGEFSSDDLLGRIFSSFCIGK